MGFAHHAKLKSKDETQVGAILVGPDREVRLTGYNGPPIGVVDSPDRRERPKKYLYVSHAEMNLVAFAARHGIRTEGCTVYVTHLCCSICCRLLIQAGVKGVIYGDGTFKSLAEERDAVMEMFSEAEVECLPLVPPKNVTRLLVNDLGQKTMDQVTVIALAHCCEELNSQGLTREEYQQGLNVMLAHRGIPAVRLEDLEAIGKLVAE